MISEAIKKVTDEMEQNKDNQYIQVVGEFLLKYLEEVSSVEAKKVLAEDKSIEKSLQYMKEEARKKVKGKVAMLSPTEGFKVVLQYYGIEGEVTMPEVDPKEVVKSVRTKPEEEVKSDDKNPAPIPVSKKVAFDVSLGDFLPKSK